MRVTKFETITALVLFSLIVLLPEYITVAGWQILFMLTLATMVVLFCCRMSYLTWRGKNEKKSS